MTDPAKIEEIATISPLDAEINAHIGEWRRRAIADADQVCILQGKLAAITTQYQNEQKAHQKTLGELSRTVAELGALKEKTQRARKAHRLDAVTE